MRHLPRLPHVRGDLLLGAISRVEHEGGSYEYVVDENNASAAVSAPAYAPAAYGRWSENI